ncbi:FAD-binding protein [Photobacterium japonica]|uniref:electron transfer flavoprotein subunit alpha/FixB family protein n=1 Tax=Photobacterium japonica TaxID=2910235 RepID=UPI003D0D9461
MAILMVAEHDNTHMSVDSLKALSAAKNLATCGNKHDIDVLIIGEHCEAVAEQARHIPTIRRILVADSIEYAHQLAENVSALVVTLSHSYSHILMAATTLGKNVLPRVAALLDVGMLSDVIAIERDDTVVRPIYAGNALARVQSSDPIKVITVRSAAFDAVSLVDAPVEGIERVTVDTAIANTTTTFIDKVSAVSERPELSAARVVVSGGRGVGSKEQFALIEQLADQLGGAVGASRAAVDAGFVANDKQVGQTGKIVAPDLYIAVGISGAIQHVAGMKDAKVIVAINSDPEAPIFEIADYGLVGDLFDVLPALISALKA